MELRLHILYDCTDDRADRRGRFVSSFKKMLVMILRYDGLMQIYADMVIFFILLVRNAMWYNIQLIKTR